jgi:hypothetical protein
MGRTGLKGNVEGSASQGTSPEGLQGHHFGMRRASSGVETFCDDLAAFDHHGTDHGIRVSITPPFSRKG